QQQLAGLSDGFERSRMATESSWAKVLGEQTQAQQSLVSETQGTIKADEAAVASAQLQLNWSRITAPIDGRVGLKQV
ncbi:DUF802 domain-containing protein, partial [Enterobacter hormaechei]|uniref:DUF802 domain-containing protein n=1 Tax=Enterobacter hormaechei TaxID=158836 RepID=UPI00203E369D